MSLRNAQCNDKDHITFVSLEPHNVYEPTADYNIQSLKNMEKNCFL